MANWSDIIEQRETLNEGLVAFYKCNDRPTGISPTVEISDSVNGQDLTFFNQTENKTYNEGIGSGLDSGDAIVFHNTSGIGGSTALTDAQYARSLFVNGLLDFGPTSVNFGKSMSISMWIKFIDKKKETNLLYKRGDGTFVPANTTQYYSFFDPADGVSEDNIVFRKGGSVGAVDAEVYTGHTDPGGDPRGQSYPIVPGAWYHIVMIYDRLGKFKPHQAGGSLYLIVNSTEAGSGAPGWDRIADARNFEEDGFMGGPCAQPTSIPSSNMENSNTEVWLGPWSTDAHAGDFAHIVMDRIGVWKKVLGSGEIKALFNEGFGQELPFINIAVSGSHGVGGIVNSKTPTDITVSGFVGGYAYAAQQFGPSGTPNGILPQFGGMVWAPYQWPVDPGVGNKIGGYFFAKPGAEARNNDFFGGYIVAPGGDKRDTFIGGFMFALPLTTTPGGAIGAIASGLNQLGPEDNNIGGWIFGRPQNTNYIEQHSRTLVKVRSQDVVDQALNLDAQLILFQRSNKDFNARLSTFARTSADFNARLNVEAMKLLPSSVISISAATDINDVTQVLITASGITYETGTFFTSANIDFGEPYGFGGTFGNGGAGNTTYNSSISGFTLTQIETSNNVVSGIHNFNYPGKYLIVASFTDNLGQVTSSAYVVNTIVSGSIASLAAIPVEGVDYPALEISGLPRSGIVPPGLFIDFDLRASGTGFVAINNAVSKLNSANPVSNSYLSWNFNNGIRSTIKQPFTTYNNPGLYTPVVRYQFIHPSGTLISASGGGPLGADPVYGNKPIWISDSLIIGFSR